MANKKKSPQIIMLDRWKDNFKKLTDEEAGKIIKAIYAYWHEGEMPKFEDRLMSFFWDDILIWLDDSRENYKNECEKNRRRIQDYWDKVKKEKTIPPNTTEYETIPPNTTEYLDKDKDKDKPKDKDKDKTDIDVDVDGGDQSNIQTTSYMDVDQSVGVNRFSMVGKKETCNEKKSLLHGNRKKDNETAMQVSDFFTGNSKAKKVLNHFRLKIGNFRSPEEYEQLKQIIIAYDETDYILYCIDFMQNEGGRSVKYLEMICESHYEGYKNAFIKE